MPRDYDLSHEEIAALPNGQEKAIQYAVSGLLTDGAHHKDWCIERVLETLGVDLVELRRELSRLDYDWEEGIAP